MKTRLIASFALLATFATAEEPAAADAVPLQELQVLKHPDLQAVTGIAISPDGKHAYGAAFQAGKLSTFDIDPDTGHLAFRNSLGGPDYGGAVTFRLSRDGKLGALSAFRPGSLLLFQRDARTGDLTLLDSLSVPDGNPELNFCMKNAFSPEGNHLYAIASQKIVVYDVSEGKLRLVQTFADEPGPNSALGDGRGIIVSPDGKWIYSTWSGSSALLTFSRDPKTGMIKPVQAIANGLGVESGLNGVMRVTTSPDGRYVYTSSGRFRGEHAVCAFSVGENGVLKWLQTLDGPDLPPNFQGGNEVAVSPDGTQLAVACTLSDHLARFRRDPATGRLTADSSLAVGAQVQPGCAGLAFHPEGRLIYVADEGSSSVVTLRISAE